MENDVLATALKGANDEVAGVIFSNMSKRLAEMINEDMQFMGPVRLRDVEEAQQNCKHHKKTGGRRRNCYFKGGGDEIIV